MTENPWILMVEVALAMGLLIFLFFRKKRSNVSGSELINKIELRITNGELTPNQVNLPAGRPLELIIYRYDREPREELFEIAELDIYELLPALHATLIKMTPVKRGTFPIILAAEKQVGIVVVS